MQGCPCGYHTAEGERCTCQPSAVARYTGRISGPLLDRVDLQVDVPRVAWEDLARGAVGEESAAVAGRVREARMRAARRLGEGRCNAEMSAGEIRRHAEPGPAGRSLLRQAVEREGWSARAFHRVLAVARTLTDLNGRDGVGVDEVAEAAAYRLLDRD